MSLTIGSILLDRYVITKILGRGGMGVVFLAEDIRLNHRACAIKLIKNDMLLTSQDLERFEKELRIISNLHTPHVVQVFDSGYTDDDQLYYVMEYLEGETLADLIKTKAPFSIEQTLAITIDILSGLGAIHEQGVIHRDLKPENIFLVNTYAGKYIVKIIDFGIAKHINDEDSNYGELTDKSTIIGTPKYMSPEQFTKDKLSIQTDLYAVGLLMYCMLKGQPPFDLQNPIIPDELGLMPNMVKIGWQHLNATPQRITNLSDSLWLILLSFLHKESIQRPTNAIHAITLLEAEREQEIPTVAHAEASDQIHNPHLLESDRPTRLSKSSNSRQKQILTIVMVSIAIVLGWFLLELTQSPSFTSSSHTTPPSSTTVVDDDPTQSTVTHVDIKLSPSKLIYRMGDILQISATAYDEQNHSLAESRLHYSSIPKVRKIDERNFKLTITGDVEIKACTILTPQVCKSITIKVVEKLKQ